MEGRYLKINPEYIYNLRRELKSYDDFFNNVLRNIRSYKLLRKKETALKNKLKIEVTALKTKLATAELTLPKQERESLEHEMHSKSEKRNNTVTTNPGDSEIIHHHHNKPITGIKTNNTPQQYKRKNTVPRESIHRSTIDRDLEEIRNKLARLRG